MANKEEMLNEEKIVSSRIIGYIEPVPNSEHAHVTIIGYKNGEGEHRALDQNNAKTLFPPKGEAFAPKFKFDYDGNNISPNSFVEFSVKISEKKNDQYDQYIVDYAHSTTPKSFCSIITLNGSHSLAHGFITQDELSSCIEKTELKNYSNQFLLKSEKCLCGLFRYEEISDSIKPIKGKETNAYEFDSTLYKRYCVRINEREYYLGSTSELPFKQVGSIDCMDDKQLSEWFKELLKACFESNVFLSIKEEIFQNFTAKFKETNDAIEDVRLERIKGKLNSLNFTVEEVKKLLELGSPLADNLNKTLKNMKEEYQSAWLSDIEKQEDTLQSEIEKLDKKKDNLKKEIEIIEEKYSIKENNLLTSYEEKKFELEDALEKKRIKLNELTERYNSILFEAEGLPFKKLAEEEGYGFPNLLKKNLELDEIPEVLKNQLNKESVLFTRKACFIPSVSWAYFYAKAIRNSKLYLIHVEHDWLHYNDFMNNGLAAILNSCYENENSNHVLVLDALNLTQPECGLKPLLDVIAGYAIVIPGMGKPFPENLKIFATILPFKGENSIGIQLDKESFAQWGTIARVEDKLPIAPSFLNTNTGKGYFEPNDIFPNPAQNFFIDDKSQKVYNGYFE